MSPQLAVSPQRLHMPLDGSQPKPPSGPVYPRIIEALNPWLYWQLADASVASGATAADSASPTQTAPTGHAWSGFNMPPPNAGTYGTVATKVPGLLSDTRSAPNTVASGAIASDTWYYYDDAPMQGSGWWIACHFEATLAQQSGYLPGVDELWVIPTQLGQEVKCSLQSRSDVGKDIVTLASTRYTGPPDDYVEWDIALGSLSVGKHQLIVRAATWNAVSGLSAVTAWLDGVDLGTKNLSALSANGPAVGYLSQGFQAGGSLIAGDAVTMQDLVVMALGASPATDMGDTLASSLYASWSSEF